LRSATYPDAEIPGAILVPASHDGFDPEDFSRIYFAISTPAAAAALSPDPAGSP
jgi:hypothetical protein